MNPEDRVEWKKFIDEFIMPFPNPLEETLKLIGQVHRHKVALLEAEIIDLKQEIKKLKRGGGTYQT